MSEEQRSSYSQILRATSIIGGAQGVNLLLGMMRIKFAAVLIGPIGVGIITNMVAIQNLIGTFAGLGIQSSAVRDIAEAFSQGSNTNLARTVLVLRRICWITGLLGLLIMLVLSGLLSQITFGSDEYRYQIAAMGLIILFGNLAGGQTALIQGSRRIGDLARLTIVGGVAGTFFSIVFYWLWGLQGIVPALISISMTQFAASWYFASKIPVSTVHLSWKETLLHSGSMLRLGLVFMWNGVLMSVIGYVINALITQQISLQAVGIYGAAFALSGMLLNFILQAMGADYYPRLSSISSDKVAMCRLVNQQTEIGMLLAIPGLVAMMTLAQWVIKVFYTTEFLDAVHLIHWLILGCYGRILSWPLGFVMLALKKGRLFFLTETSGGVLHLIFVLIGLNYWGLEGAAVGFFSMYVFYLLMVFLVARRLIGFNWTGVVLKMLLVSLMLFAIVFQLVRLRDYENFYLFSIVLCVVTALISAKKLRDKLHA